MIRLPSKLYQFNESILADFVTILRYLDEDPIKVETLHARLLPTMATEDFIDALALLLTLGKVELDNSEGVIHRAH
ncbi:ABC-three component system middle component 7 [Rothia sp. ZJ1223]|uniref:ABC-three component system middle component 7 n=1 Tax=Rothia sp. ZJ1223 TaxID=2811098 RepID=UPI001958DFD5|nr:ABC-three component system middle component 7 [Rothia sp. ZJ1223]MBM7051024.1 hypothetical protein [Rothia sp. ZJ1223]